MTEKWCFRALFCQISPTKTQISSVALPGATPEIATHVINLCCDAVIQRRRSDLRRSPATLLRCVACVCVAAFRRCVAIAAMLRCCELWVGHNEAVCLILKLAGKYWHLQWAGGGVWPQQQSTLWRRSR